MATPKMPARKAATASMNPVVASEADLNRTGIAGGQFS